MLVRVPKQQNYQWKNWTKAKNSFAKKFCSRWQQIGKKCFSIVFVRVSELIRGWLCKSFITVIFKLFFISSVSHICECFLVFLNEHVFSWTLLSLLQPRTIAITTMISPQHSAREDEIPKHSQITDTRIPSASARFPQLNYQNRSP